ncbi:MAG TPA: VOC family protein [Pseudomonadales bacterium]|nr:VOC family protein [Pseudomonadales bacterium]
MILAKPALDIGIQLAADTAEELEAVLDAWQAGAGVRPDHVLPLGGGRRQHRHAWGDSVIKLNHRRGGTARGEASGWGPLRLAGPEHAEAHLVTDPEGNQVACAPAAEVALQVDLRVRDADASAAFFAALDLPVDGHVVQVGTSAIHIRTQADAPVDAVLEGTGLRYVTLQVTAVDSAHAQALAAGAREGMAPTTLGDVARISFVREPGGNWIELSQRRSVVGSLEPS